MVTASRTVAICKLEKGPYTEATASICVESSAFVHSHVQMKRMSVPFSQNLRTGLAAPLLSAIYWVINYLKLKGIAGIQGPTNHLAPPLRLQPVDRF